MDYKEKVYCQSNILVNGYGGGLGAINRRKQNQHNQVEQNLGKTVEFHFQTLLNV
jgi:hypothetical protein